MPGSSLFPGYHLVEAFGPDEDYEQCDSEVEEEVVYVTLDLGTVEPALVPSTSSYRLIGLDTPTPYLQLSGTTFRGQHESLLGTELLFTEGKDDNGDRSRKSLVHFGSTEHRIRFKEVELQEKNTGIISKDWEISSTVRKRNPKTMNHLLGTVDNDASSSKDKNQSGSSKAKSKAKGKGKGKGKEKAVGLPEDSATQLPGDTQARTKSGRSQSKKKDKGKGRAVEPPIPSSANVPSDAPADGGPQPMDVDDG
ncbi:hypothetical protein SCP_0503470 [Sparassis crispa]|uniref:Transcription factor TFIIIC triple barrel domain-containing protein n=1 Tax=Sparassis crispa TaxID=139825 RepID=A0A401GMB5_9APHY|nr:hypothetical protein SCP_0503470 [Sparassis crispa]GBE83299.1 hypothetical protein SCP_0503470 [Sparassis crispa]